jgi:hypothetical protein
LFEQVKDRAPWGLRICLVKRGDRMSWSRPVSVHEHRDPGLGLYYLAGMAASRG